jgi:hypothetical protein
MESKQFTAPTEKNDEHGYGLAYRLAGEQLAGIEDIEEQCRKSGSRYSDSEKAITVEYLNQSYRVAIPEIEIKLMSKEKEVPLRDKILILHYLNTAKGTPFSNKVIAFKELAEGANYFPTFYHRSIQPLADHFGNEPHRLLRTAQALGGHEADFGDAAVTINAFARVPITLVLWRGDEEFAPEGNILFDSTIPDYLPTEDIIVLCETTVRILIKRLKSGGDSPGRS